MRRFEAKALNFRPHLRKGHSRWKSDHILIHVKRTRQQRPVTIFVMCGWYPDPANNTHSPRMIFPDTGLSRHQQKSSIEQFEFSHHSPGLFNC
jgi:hypothetical protein